jgi:hypothetical protein
MGVEPTNGLTELTTHPDNSKQFLNIFISIELFFKGVRKSLVASFLQSVRIDAIL